ncbi:hypothetical protein [Solemya velum gill symbiont]|uniref:hypothetical protein n=1 Tax=Solemya velum gill symbiont TaxID=2340 RepID=UPI000997A21B|nr:hypothetical protein [Solemya velum gill symbiont]OOZ44240.1 hypothetical protein BOW37_07610 [Solemya velum gill symbiont]OOZ48004.1 hypothetical protein BOW38_00630 [Solemya velum gill symbiont]OOZ52947.1 hypothetical protein BOW40_00635 [Solemya velum gill symbiont]OOZ55621.1 hypothetical protein BOW42_09645 [Solemya velum gill symbiont]OOZ56214.1 hypothetical protein BOW41_00635 [Solemya velum gill symbiont]
MTLESLTNDAVGQIEEVFSKKLTAQETEKVSKIVEKALIKAVTGVTKHYVDAASLCCGPEADMAHKIKEEVERKKHALFGNLISLR